MINKNLCKNLHGSLNQCEQCFKFVANDICIELKNNKKEIIEKFE